MGARMSGVPTTALSTRPLRGLGGLGSPPSEAYVSWWVRGGGTQVRRRPASRWLGEGGGGMDVRVVAG